MTETRQATDPKPELVGHFARMLRVPAADIDCDAHILELGVDSIMLVEAQQWLSTRFGCRIEIARFFEELHTINRIAAFVGASAPQASALSIAASAEADRGDAPAASGGRAGTRPAARAADFALMRSQLALVIEVIEAQNRVLRDSEGHGQ